MVRPVEFDPARWRARINPETRDAAKTTLRLILRPCMFTSDKHADKLDAYLDGHYIVTSREPLFDGARELLRRRYDPDTLLTTRHDGKAFDNFEPLSLARLAGLTMVERDKRGLQLVKWKPHPKAVSRHPLEAPTRVAAE